MKIKLNNYKKILLILVLISTIPLFFSFKFSFNKDDIIMISGTFSENIYVNDKFAKKWDVENLAKLYIYKVEDDFYYIKGKYFFYEINNNEKNLFDYQQVQFKQLQNGQMIIEDKYLYPTLRSSPTFPEKEVEIGDTWTGNGEEMQDFSNFSIKGLHIKIPINISYKYIKDEEKDGKIYAVIEAHYTMMYPFEKENFRKYDENNPQMFTGNVSITYYWDKEEHHVASFIQKFNLYLIMLDGTRFSFEGTGSGKMEVIKKLNESKKEKIVNDIKKSLPENIKDVEVKNTKKGIVFELGEIFFDFDSSKLNPEELEKLDTIGQLINKYFPGYQIVIEGYTDNIGSEQYNLNLSKMRAYNVYNYLLTKHYIDEATSSFVGYGESNPAYPNDTEENRKKNRRVEIVIIDY